MRNLEQKSNDELCVWKLTKLSIPICLSCEGFNVNCLDYLNYQQSRKADSLVEKYEQLIRRQNVRTNN